MNVLIKPFTTLKFANCYVVKILSTAYKNGYYFCLKILYSTFNSRSEKLNGICIYVTLLEDFRDFKRNSSKKVFDRRMIHDFKFWKDHICTMCAEYV